MVKVIYKDKTLKILTDIEDYRDKSGALIEDGEGLLDWADFLFGEEYRKELKNTEEPTFFSRERVAIDAIWGKYEKIANKSLLEYPSTNVVEDRYNKSTISYILDNVTKIKGYELSIIGSPDETEKEQERHHLVY